MKNVRPAASAREAGVMWKNVAIQGAVSAHTTPTPAAASEQVQATSRRLRTSSTCPRRANDSSTFCGPASARNRTKVSARLRLSTPMIMPCGAPADTAVYYRPRVSVVLALYAGSGWSRASFRALIHRPEPAEDEAASSSQDGRSWLPVTGRGAPGRRNPDVTRQGHPDRPLRAAVVAGRAVGR